MLALALGGRTIAEWQACMTQPEFNEWMAFFRLYPFDDYHRFHRPAALIATVAGGGRIEPRLEWLQPEPVPEGYSLADINTFKAFGVKPPVKNG